MIILKSSFAEHISRMIEHKESLGYSRSSYEIYLGVFDRFCAERYPAMTELTKDLVMEWAEVKPRESINSQRRRLAAIREFARYLQSLAMPAYILPPNMTASQTKYIPHIYTDNELSAFFYGADHHPRDHSDLLAQYIVPVMFRVIYCCGLRPNEGRTLRTRDLDFTTGKLLIREAKRHKERIVILAPDVLDLCRKYAAFLSRIHGVSEYLFPESDGKARTTQWTGYQFKRCWKTAGVTEFQSSTPRIYDFRHTFATRCLYQWMDERKDLYHCLPYLSAYMGHSKFSSTAYYIHLLPERLTQSQAVDWSAFSELIPEVVT